MVTEVQMVRWSTLFRQPAVAPTDKSGMSDLRGVGGAGMTFNRLQIQDRNTVKPGQDEHPPQTGAQEEEQDSPLAWQPPRPGDPVARALFEWNFKGGVSAAPAGGVTTFGFPLTKKIDGYFDKSHNEYTLPDGSKVQAAPSFRMNSHDNGAQYQEQLEKALKPKDEKFRQAIHMVAYGRGTPEQIQQVTQALIDKGGLTAVKDKWTRLGEAQFKATYPNTTWPLTDADAVKLLQFSAGVGVDCAGYVQQEFLAVHGGSRAHYGFQSIGGESLTDLKDNSHFKQVGPTDAQPGDLMILDHPVNDTVGHTVMIQDRHPMTAAEQSSYPGIDKFAKPGEKVQVFVVEASFGAGPNGDPTQGGVQRRTFFYNESTGKWADMRRDWDKPNAPTVHISSTSGPYEHPMNGIYHPKG